ncbi:sel1 repeat family protein [Candidatus Izemoplasma sp. B36]|uniref:sel1 repeat family protein n=1 Tax=Candidatus Izemoplasma sp. B36 TaxID=3242468 RepID=UPI003555DBDA
MRNNKFIILNIIATILEISLLLLFLILSIEDNPILGVVCLVLYIAYLLMMIRVSLYKKSIFNTIDFPIELFDKIHSIYTQFKKYYPDIEVKFFYVDDKSFLEPAAYLDGKIYINSLYKFDDVFLYGIIGHELGHSVSQLVKYKIVYLLRITSIIARQIYTFRYKNRKYFNPKVMKPLDYLLLGVYNIFNLFDHIVTNPYFRRDEIFANSVAAKIGCGESLRYFYFNSLINTKEDIKLISKYYDYKHPSASVMIEKLESEMNLDDSEIDVFAVNNVIRKIRNTNSLTDKHNKIMNWYHYKSTQNIDIIFYDLGMIYLRGKYGCKIDKTKSIEYLLKAKDLKYLPAIYELSVIHYNNRNYQESFNDFNKLVEKKYRKAYIYLANSYAYGYGTKKDNEKAYQLYKLAAEENNIMAKNYLTIINQTFKYQSHSNKAVEIVEDRYIFNSVDDVIRIDSNNNEYKYSIKLFKSFVILLDDNNKEYTRFVISKDKIIRKNTIIRIDESKIYKTNIVYDLVENK